MSIEQGTVDLTKNFAHSIDTVFAAWSSEAAQRVWSDPGNDWEMRFDQFRFAVGEIDVCRFGPKGTEPYVNENRYLIIDPQKRIVCSTSLRRHDKLNFAGTLAVTFESRERGTRLHLIEQGLYFDAGDDVEGHRAGWESMLDALGSYLAKSTSD